MSFPNLEFFDKSSDSADCSILVEGRVSSVEPLQTSFVLGLDLGIGGLISIPSFYSKKVGDRFIVDSNLISRGLITAYDLNWTGAKNSASSRIVSFEGIDAKKSSGSSYFVSKAGLSEGSVEVSFTKFQSGKRFKCFVATDGLRDYFVPLGALKFYRSRGGGLSLIWFMVEQLESWLDTRSNLLSNMHRSEQANRYYKYKSIQMLYCFNILVKCLKYMPFKDLEFLKHYLLVRFSNYYRSVLELELGSKLVLDTVNKCPALSSKFDSEFCLFYLLTKDRVSCLSLLLWYMVSSEGSVVDFNIQSFKPSLKLSVSANNTDEDKAHFLPVLVNQSYIV